MTVLSDMAVAAKPRALVSPEADFWLVGGASVVAFALFVAITQAANVNLGNKPFYWAFYVSFFLNNPHFVFSYFLFYRGFWQRLRSKATERLNRLRMITAGIIVPLLMALFMVFAFLHPEPQYVRWAMAVMVFSVGWHYVKQGYGVLITLSLYEGVVYTAKEKRVFWLSAYATWVYSWVCSLAFGVSFINPAGGVTHTPNFLPGFEKPALAGILLAVPPAVTLARKYMKGGGISINAVTGYACAAWLWVMMPFIDAPFLALVPMFHALQYLPFVYKMKKSEFGEDRKNGLRDAVLRLAVFTLLGLALSVLLFESLPKFLDAQAPAWHLKLPTEFFFMMFLSFINIHHYFMDSAYWRRDNDDVQRNLFQA
jgi:hypothetical protein